MRGHNEKDRYLHSNIYTHLRRIVQRTSVDFVPMEQAMHLLDLDRFGPSVKSSLPNPQPC